MGSPLLWFGNAAKFLKSQIVIPASTSGALTLQPAASTTSYTLTAPSAQASGTQVLQNNGSGVLSWSTAATGSVSSVSVVSANGLAGTVATATTTPAITLSTTITGILQGNGTAISAASTTGSGAVVLATSPTLVTPALGTPSAVVLTSGTGLPLTTGVTGTLPIANGGTNATTAANARTNLGVGTADTPTFFDVNLSGLSSNSVPYTGGDNLFHSSAVTPTELGYVSGVTSSIQTQLNAKGTGTVTSVAATVPAFLSISGSPITTSGTLAIGFSGTALPIANGGTAGTTKASAFNNLSPMTLLGDIIYGGTAGAGTPLGIGSTGQVLTVAAGIPSWATPTTGTVTSVALTVPAFLSVSGSPVTSSGTLAVSFSGTAIPIANGGTSATTKAGAFDALSPMTTGGDVIYGGASGTGTRLANGSSGQVLTSGGGTAAPTWTTPTTGTVTSVSVVSANGLAGTVATSTTTPAITLTTTITGILQGNGTAISAATTTGSGSVVLATSPTLVTPALGTPSAIVLTSGTGLPLTTGVTGTLPLGNGGTNATTKAGAFDSLSPMTTGGDIIYGGASGTGTRLANGSNGQVLTSSGGTTAPTWTTLTGTGTVTSVALTVPAFLSVSGSPITTSGTLAVTLSGTALPIANGGTGQTTAATAFNAIAVGTNTNNNATAGNLGEYVFSTISSAIAYVGASGAYGDLTSISLTAGDWDVTGIVSYSGGTGGTFCVGAVSTTPNNNGAGLTFGDNAVSQLASGSVTGVTADVSAVVPAIRVSISGTTTYYLKYRSGWTVAPTIYGRISARRVR